ncbi:MAG TPA: helix-turn-helix domain-containing protein [Geminicoccaceae bacterium]|nr:helix-turn-helix domain-containing protein [Geminicoccaceae bacterium]
MPRACSTDLRERVLAAYEAGEGSQAAVARRFRVGERTLSRWLRAARAEGRRGPKPAGRGRAPRRSGARRRCWPGWWRNRTTPRWPSTPTGSPRARACGAALPRRAGP